MNQFDKKRYYRYSVYELKELPFGLSTSPMVCYYQQTVAFIQCIYIIVCCKMKER